MLSGLEHTRASRSSRLEHTRASRSSNTLALRARTQVPLALESMMNSTMTMYVLELPLESVKEKSKIMSILSRYERVEKRVEIIEKARKILNMEVMSVVVTPPRVLDMMTERRRVVQKSRRRRRTTSTTTTTDATATPTDALRDLRKIVNENERRRAALKRLDTRYVELSKKLYTIVQRKDKRSVTGHVHVSIVSQLCALRRSANEIVDRHVMRMERFALKFLQHDILSKHTHKLANSKALLPWIDSVLELIDHKTSNCAVAKYLLECGVFENVYHDDDVMNLLGRYVPVLFRSPTVMRWITPHFEILSKQIKDVHHDEMFELLTLLLKHFIDWELAHNKTPVDNVLKVTVKSLATSGDWMDSLSMTCRIEIVRLITRLVSMGQEWENYGTIISLMCDRDEVDVKCVLLSCLESSENKTNALFVLDSVNLDGATTISESEFQILLSMRRRTFSLFAFTLKNMKNIKTHFQIRARYVVRRSSCVNVKRVPFLSSCLMYC